MSNKTSSVLNLLGISISAFIFVACSSTPAENQDQLQSNDPTSNSTKNTESSQAIDNSNENQPKSIEARIAEAKSNDEIFQKALDAADPEICQEITQDIKVRNCRIQVIHEQAFVSLNAETCQYLQNSDDIKKCESEVQIRIDAQEIDPNTKS